MCDGDYRNGPNEPTLVKYDHPQLITRRNINPILSEGNKGLDNKVPLTQKLKAGTITSICHEVLSGLETEDILNSILPPREWQEAGNKWKQNTSSVPATDADIQALLNDLNNRMVERSARETGICPVRRDLYAQCLDELIRQVTITCAERGVLLLRIRDELRMTMAAYESLYISATAYSMRRTLLNELTRLELEAQIDALHHEREQLGKDKLSLNEELQKIVAENEIAERREQEVRALEIENLKKINTELKKQMEACVGFKKRAPAHNDD